MITLANLHIRFYYTYVRICRSLKSSMDMIGNIVQ